VLQRLAAAAARQQRRADACIHDVRRAAPVVPAARGGGARAPGVDCVASGGDRSGVGARDVTGRPGGRRHEDEHQRDERHRPRLRHTLGVAPPRHRRQRKRDDRQPADGR
jgi:hypothetical protein